MKIVRNEPYDPQEFEDFFWRMLADEQERSRKRNIVFLIFVVIAAVYFFYKYGH